jgi:DNA-binding NarL/FixJ family response regulator
MQLQTDTTSLLTSQEHHVLSLAATGLTSSEIATAMSVPLGDVHRWLRCAIVRLRAHSKLEAVLIARRTGQLDELRA